MLVQPGKTGWVEILSAPEQLGAVLQGVIPADDRHYDGEKWHVLKKHLLAVVRAGYEISGRVDYSRMPGAVQMDIAEAKKHWIPGSIRVGVPAAKVKSDPYAVLHLLPGAPIVVVKAAFRALSKKHHPDQGGDPNRFKEILGAYEDITKK